ncbi:primosomal protein N' [Propionibacterium sp. oral taxon 192 str. F0372]|nr:primosomal protein N' [Propionibacterium sp. oral taxon 192 str. F0372]
MEMPAGPLTGGITVARVAVDVVLPHLDRFFDYLVPPLQVDEVVVGSRVRVRFAGRMRDGFVVEITDHSEVTGTLLPLSKVVSSEPVLSLAQIELIRRVADHYAGCFADVVRLAVPPRHATTEKAPQREWPEPLIEHLPAGGLLHEVGGQHFLDSLSRGEPIRVHWQVRPRHRRDESGLDDWTRGVVQSSIATLRARRGVIIVVPDYRDLGHVRSALGEAIGPGAVAELHSDLGPAARYRNYLAVSRGQAQVVVGTRGVVHAPVHRLGLIVVWDDGDDLHSETRAPYPHARDVAALRASSQRCGLLLASHGRSCEVQAWIDRGWCVAVGADSVMMRSDAPVVRAAVDSRFALDRDPRAQFDRLPRAVFETIRRGLASGPVLVQVPRAGYLPAVSCATCHVPVRCSVCHGPVRLNRPDGPRRLDCAWCGRIITTWRCEVCHGDQLRAPVVGAGRTVEELGRAFPGTRVIESSGERLVEQTGTHPCLVVATPGAEPPAVDGYSAAVLLDAARLLDRVDLRAAEEALRRWLNAVALVRPAERDGTVVVVGPAGARPIQALVRLDPGASATAELVERIEAGFPPAVRFVTVTGGSQALHEFIGLLGADHGAELLGPVELDEPLAVGQTEPNWQLSLRCPITGARRLLDAVKSALAGRSARKMTGSLRVRVDPVAL